MVSDGLDRGGGSSCSWCIRCCPGEGDGTTLALDFPLHLGTSGAQGTEKALHLGHLVALMGQEEELGSSAGKALEAVLAQGKAGDEDVPRGGGGTKQMGHTWDLSCELIDGGLGQLQ